jgi:hypothetical protein
LCDGSTQIDGIFSAVAAGTYSVTVKIQQDVYQMQHLLDNQCTTSYAGKTYSYTKVQNNGSWHGTVQLLLKTSESINIDGSTYTNTTGIFSAVALEPVIW